MFETAEVGQSLDAEAYEREVPELRTQLLKLQAALEKSSSPVLIVLHGVDAGGRTEMLHVLHEWLDTRYLSTCAWSDRSEEERQRPEYWRYWTWLPPRGRIAICYGSWYTRPLTKRVYNGMSDAKLELALMRVLAFEKALIDDGALIIKFWFHISQSEQFRRYKELESSKRTKWRVNKESWKNHAHYDEIVRAGERILRATSNGEAPWTIVEGTDERLRNVTVARHVIERLSGLLATKGPRKQARPQDPNVPNPTTILDTLDLNKQLEKPEYQRKLEALQGRLNRAGRQLRKKRRSAIAIFEGWDAAGKGGAIRRVTSALDARQYTVVPVATPTQDEKARHYLWRFWRHIPGAGRFAFFDRSWYGRVLVERIEGYATLEEWMRAYKEIVDFEDQIAESGIVLVKFWMHISEEEQARRFKERELEPWKQHKITAEDYRNRQKTNLYEAAANDMITRTSTELCPWTLVEGEDKRFARIKVLETLCDRLESI